MKDDIYIEFINAKKEKNIKELKRLFVETNDTTIGLEYAKSLIFLKRYDEARKILETLLSTNNKYFAILELGKLEKKLGNIKKARNFFKESLNSKGRVKLFSLSELAQLEYSVGNFNDSFSYFEQLIGTNIEESILYDLSLVSKKLGYYDKSLKYLEKYVKNNPADNIALFELGKLEKKMGNSLKALEIFESLLNTSSRNFALLELGKLEMELKNFDRARYYLEKLYRCGFKDKCFASIELGRLEKIEGNYDKAKEYFYFLLECSGKDKLIATLELGKLEKLLGNNFKALEYFNKLIGTGSENFAKIELARMNVENGDLDSAYQLLIEVYNSKTFDKVQVLKELGKIERERNNKLKAKEFYLEALNVSFENCDKVFLLTEIGKIERELGNFECSRKYFEILIEENKNIGYLELGKLEVLLGNNEAALNYFEKLYNTELENMAFFEIGKLYVNEGNYVFAKENFNKLIDTDLFCYSMFELGKLELIFNNFDNASNCFNSLIGTESELNAKLELGKLELELGNFEKARKYFYELLNTNIDLYAKLQLGILESEYGDSDKSREYFNCLLNSENREYALLELGKLEYRVNNVMKSREIFKGLLNSDYRTMSYALKVLIILEIKENNLNEVLKYSSFAIKNNVLLPNYLILYLSKVLNNFFVKYDYKNALSYQGLQLIDYDEFVALDNIVCKHKNEFNSDIDIYKLFITIKNELIDKYKSRELVMNDIYFIPYKNCGKNGESLLKVVCLPNSKDIITMYPVFNSLSYNYKNCDVLNGKNFSKKKKFL